MRRYIFGRNCDSRIWNSHVIVGLRLLGPMRCSGTHIWMKRISNFETSIFSKYVRMAPAIRFLTILFSFIKCLVLIVKHVPFGEFSLDTVKRNYFLTKNAAMITLVTPPGESSSTTCVSFLSILDHSMAILHRLFGSHESSNTRSKVPSNSSYSTSLDASIFLLAFSLTLEASTVVASFSRVFVRDLHTS